MAAKASAAKSAGVPKGMKPISGGYAKSWDVDAMPEIHGTAGEIKTVKLTQKRKGKVEEVERRCVEVKNKADGERYTVWESATLTNLFDALAEAGEGTVIWIRYTGLGVAKKGQNPPKLFESAIG